ncbi:LIC_13346 family putative lipoprotein [Leptospira barantonii]|uniref:Lipoprotein n=1 Tax=Leptospira barantonii TaxID=2023184 RepID=A0ABX4NHB9_9LEPT|nr:hypothetical protein [Leptospira barantonii]PJZ56210.1 hypothetical protein CH367_15230 [Leptospira barantonii]
MKTVFRHLQMFPLRFENLRIQSFILVLSLLLFHCGSIEEILSKVSKPLSENYSSQIFFVSSPIVSPYYETSSFQARYAILKNRQGKDEMVQGILKYLELSGKTEQQERILFEVSEWIGPIEKDPNDKSRIGFFPKFITKRSEVSNGKSLPEVLNLEPKREVFEDVKKEFVITSEGGLREAEEIRVVPGIGTLKWKHSLRGILVKIMQTEFVSANGTVTSSRDYDYDSLEYPPAIGLTGSIPILPLRKTDAYVEYYCLDFPSEIDLSVLRKKEGKKSVSFYDLTANKPFTTTANFKNYPIIRISNEKNQSP